MMPLVAILFWSLIALETIIGGLAFLLLMLAAGLQYVVNFICDTARKIRR